MPAPPDGGDDGRELDAVAQRRDRGLENAVVAVDHAFEPAFVAILARALAAGECPHADVARVGGVEPANELLGERSLAREPLAAGPSVEELSEAAVPLASGRQRAIGCL